ncbi:TonB-dependent receptor domain-containing protein [Thermodesulfobacteriota bacterium]
MKNCYQITKEIGKTTTFFVLSFFCLLLMGNPVWAQDENTSEEVTLEEVTVTGSIIRSSGMDTPTPVTVVSMPEIELISPITMVEGLAELPQFYGSNTTQNVGGYWTTTGAGSLNLRGLNSKRTLQLLDGRRMVPSTIFSTSPDINLFPEFLIRSVETVTGGASATYGTDAVAGVVNFLLNKEFEGIKGKVQYGMTERGHNKNNKYALAGGFAVTDRTHVLFSVEKSEQDPIQGYDILEYEWYNATSLLENTAAGAGDSPDNPFYLPAQRVRSMNASLDGILLFPDSAGGRYIFDENGVTTPFVMGDWCNTHGCSTVNGGSGTDNIFPNASSVITPDSSRENLFGYVDYDVSHKLKIYGQVVLGKAQFKSKNFGGIFAGGRAFTIYSGNPFLPADMQQIMTDNSLDSVKLGRIGGYDDVGRNGALGQETETLSLTGGFEYNIASSGFLNGWQVKGYYQVGETEMKAPIYGGIRLDRIYLAADAVVDPDTGAIVCNVTYTSGLYPDCVPINFFGRGNASGDAINWVTGYESGETMTANGFLSADESLIHSYTSVENKQRIVDIFQRVFEITADGDLFEGWGAGPIKGAIGYGYRKESFTQVVQMGPGGNINTDPTYRPVMANDPLLGIRGVPGGNAASGNHVSAQFTNTPHARGEQSVHEYFAELLVPLLADFTAVKQLNLTGAVRRADYSGSGGTYSWKTGFDWAPYDDLRIRYTLSQDVRAATIGEKYDRTGGLGFVTDYLADPGGTHSYWITSFSNGSPDIKPEEAETSTIGVVYRPSFIEGLSIAIDWYEVEVTNNINQIGAGDVTSGCYQDGDVDLCNMITRTGEPSTFAGAPAGLLDISLVGVPYYNQASVKGTGIDFEIGYQRPVNWFGGGETAGLRLLASHLEERSNTDSAGNKTEVQGAFQSGIPYPELTALLSGNYNRGPLGVSLQLRYTDDIMINRNWNHNGTSTRWDVLDNTLDSTMLFDMRVNYRFDMNDTKMMVYLNVNNLFDKDPEEYYTGAFSSFFSNDTGRGHYGDLRGRRFVVGLNFEF